MSRIQSKLSDDWWEHITSEEKEQATSIRLWKNPEVKGYEGLFAYGDLMYASAKVPRTLELVESAAPRQTNTHETEIDLILDKECYPALSYFEKYILLSVSTHGIKKTASDLEVSSSTVDGILYQVRLKMKKYRLA